MLPKIRLFCHLLVIDIPWYMRRPSPINENNRFSAHVRHYHRSGASERRTWDQWVDGEDAKPGSYYKLKISDSRNNDEVVYTPNFKVVPKVPLLIKAIVPLAVIGGVVAALGGGGGGEPGGSNGTTSTEIPLPALPGN